MKGSNKLFVNVKLLKRVKFEKLYNEVILFYILLKLFMKKPNESSSLHFWKFRTLTFICIFKTVPMLWTQAMGWWLRNNQMKQSNETFLKQL